MSTDVVDRPLSENSRAKKGPRAAKMPSGTPNRGGKKGGGGKKVAQPVTPAKPRPTPKTATSQAADPAPAGPGPTTEVAVNMRDQAEALQMAANHTRLRLLLMLAERDRNVGELAVLLGQTQPAISHHLALLRHGRVVEVRRDGKHNYYGLAPVGTAIVTAVRTMI